MLGSGLLYDKFFCGYLRRMCKIMGFWLGKVVECCKWSLWVILVGVVKVILRVI